MERQSVRNDNAGHPGRLITSIQPKQEEESFIQTVYISSLEDLSTPLYLAANN